MFVVHIYFHFYDLKEGRNNFLNLKKKHRKSRITSQGNNYLPSKQQQKKNTEFYSKFLEDVLKDIHSSVYYKKKIRLK